MGHHFRPHVRFNSYQHLKHKNSSSQQALERFAVLLLLALLFVSGAGTGECIAAPAKHGQQAREKGQALNDPVANSVPAIPLPTVLEHPVRVSVVPVKGDLVYPAPKGVAQDQTAMVVVGGFEPVSLVNSSLGSSLQVEQKEVFVAHNKISNKAPARGVQKATWLGSFDRGSDAWAGDGKESASAEEGGDAGSESRTGIDIAGIESQ